MTELRYGQYAGMSPEEVIKSLVEPAIKGTELAARFTAIMCEQRPTEKYNLFYMLEEMVKNGEIMELEYILTSMDYRVKSIYFPVGTKINKIDKSGK